MNFTEILQQFVADIEQTGPLEYIAVFAGIGSVWFSRKENILVYPIGLVSTVIYIYLSFKFGLFGEASVNLYYTIMSIQGWILWAKKDSGHQPVLHISSSSRKEIIYQFLFFACCYIIIFLLLTYLKKNFAPEAIPWGDAFASATAFTGMWLMNRKKVESWFWWMATNIASIPLYFVKHYVLTSVFYFILLIMAVFGWIEWRRRQQQNDLNLKKETHQWSN